MTRRHPQWPERLHAFIEAAAVRPYRPGAHNCLTFAAGAVKAVTGKDYGKPHRGKYRSAAGGYRYLRSLGFGSPEAMIDSLLPQKPVAFAQRGDLVLASDGIPAVCMGGFALSVGEDGSLEGLVQVPRSEWVKAWAVGDHHSGAG